MSDVTEQSAVNRIVEGHYSKRDLCETILAALERSGKDTGKLGVDDLHAIDEFHVGRLDATRDLARRADIRDGMRVLDVGCGIGGPARTLAREFGARVTGIDLTAEYCRAAATLTGRVGLSDRVAFAQADALRLPFADASFDAVWTQHASMNIPDKARLHAELARVLKRGGILAMYDILAGATAPVHFPVPWARTPEASFLVGPDALRRSLERAGFSITGWLDRTDAALEWFAGLSKKIEQAGLPALGTHLLVGVDVYPAMARNQVRNLREGRIALAEIVATR